MDPTVKWSTSSAAIGKCCYGGVVTTKWATRHPSAQALGSGGAVGSHMSAGGPGGAESSRWASASDSNHPYREPPEDPSPPSNAESSDRAEAPSRSSNPQPLTRPVAGGGRSPLRLCLGGCGREPRATCDVCEECEATLGPLAPRAILYAGGECQVCGSRTEGSTRCEVCEPALRLMRLIQPHSGLGPARRRRVRTPARCAPRGAAPGRR